MLTSRFACAESGRDLAVSLIEVGEQKRALSLLDELAAAGALDAEARTLRDWLRNTLEQPL